MQVCRVEYQINSEQRSIDIPCNEDESTDIIIGKAVKLLEIRESLPVSAFTAVKVVWRK